MSAVRVLHLNIRITEGGAARVARELHFGLGSLGIESCYGYGYSRRGQRSSLEASQNTVFRISHPIQSAANLAIHRLVGIDPVMTFGSGLSELQRKLDWCNVIHLHAIHSHFIPYRWLLSHLKKLQKPILWTAHDHWMVTGRCAFTDGCTRWKTGCGKCETQSNYPAAYIDFSAGELATKRTLIKSIDRQLTVISPSEHLGKDIRNMYPSIELSVIPNSIDQELELMLEERAKRKASSAASSLGNESPARILVIANDLAYEGKTNRPLIERVLTETAAEIVTVGRNSPFSGARVTNHGDIHSREQLLNVYQSCSALLFSSVVDNFPLVLCEAQSAGLPVLATPSPAAEEVLSFVGGQCLVEDKILAAIRDRTFWAGYPKIETPDSLISESKDAFGFHRMLGKYAEAYRSAISKWERHVSASS